MNKIEEFFIRKIIIIDTHFFFKVKIKSCYNKSKSDNDYSIIEVDFLYTNFVPNFYYQILSSHLQK